MSASADGMFTESSQSSESSAISPEHVNKTMVTT